MRANFYLSCSICRSLLVFVLLSVSSFTMAQSNREIVKLPFYVTDGVLISDGRAVSMSFDSDDIDKFCFDPIEVSFTNAMWKESYKCIEVSRNGTITLKNVNPNLVIKSITWEGSATTATLKCGEANGNLNVTNGLVTWISPSDQVQEVTISVSGNASNVLTRISRFEIEYENLAHEIKKVSFEYDKLRYCLHDESVFKKWDGSASFDGKVEYAKDENEQVLIYCKKLENSTAENPYGILSLGGFEVIGGNAQESVSLSIPNAKMVALSMRASNIATANTVDKSRYFVKASSGTFYCVGNKPDILTDWGNIKGVEEVIFTPASGDMISSGPVWQTLDIYYYLEEESLPASKEPIIEGKGKFVDEVVIVMNTDVPNTVIYYTKNGVDPDVKVLSNGKVQVNSAELYNGTGITISETTEFRALAVTEGHDVSPVVKAKFEKLTASVSPTISGDEKFDTNVNVVIISPNSNSKIYYTLDGGDPEVEFVNGAWEKSQNTLLYDKEIVLSNTTTLKALAVSEGQGPSAIVEKTFTKVQRVEKPDLGSSDKELFSDIALVTIKDLPQGAKLLYTLDGSDPTFTEGADGPIPTGKTIIAEQNEIKVTESCTLTLIIWEMGKLPSLPVRMIYSKTTATQTPIITGNHHFIGSTEVVISASDGSTPFTASSGSCKLYSEPLILTATTTVKAIAVEDNLLPSAISERKFTCWEKTPVPTISGDFTFADLSEVRL